MTSRLPVVLLLAAAAAAIAGSAVDARAQGKRPDAASRELALMNRSPLFFYLAKGEPNSCGPGCDEWIAADGYFDRAAAQRLRAFLARVPQPGPPIFFQSHGGVQSTAITIGRLLRERGMTAGVARTIPEGCADARSCQNAKQPGQKLVAELRAAGADCSSACVYALIGAKVRHVPLGARLGVHSSKLVQIYTDGRVRSPSRLELSPRDLARTRDFDAQLRKYVRDMGIAGELVDAAAAIAHEKVRFLERDEIIRYGIDRREFLESSWSLVEQGPLSVGIVKILESRRPGTERAVKTVLRLSCTPRNEMMVQVMREFSEGDRIEASSLRLEAGGRHVAVRLKETPAQRDNQKFGIWASSVPLALFNDVVETIELAETTDAASSGLRTTVLSTPGLAKSSAALLPRCRSVEPVPYTNTPFGRM